jgi:diacylglycerol kinase (ATP)
MDAPPLLIVNPACGASSAAKGLPEVLAAVESALGDVVIRYTARRGHARELATEGAVDGHPLIVAVGGDGTFSEVANGVLNACKQADPHLQTAAPAVGLIDLGTGGDFRRSLGIGSGFERCLEALSLGRERLVDVGRAAFTDRSGKRTEQYFVNVLSAGLGGLVDRYMERMPPWVGGKTGYYLASLAAVLASKERPLLARVRWQGEIREEVIPAFLVAICNGRWFGGGMDIAPMALPDDGRLEVVTITERNRLFLAAKSRTIYTARHLDEPTVHHFPCEQIELSLEDPAAERSFLLDVDGDPLGCLPLLVEVLPRVLKVRA